MVAPKAATGGRTTPVRREHLAGYLFVLPDALGLLVFVGLPMLLSFALGFYKVNGFGGYVFAGLANYRRMAADPQFWQSLKVTFYYVIMLVPSLYCAGLGLALLVRRKGPFNGLMRCLFFLPQMLSLVVVALIWQFLAVDKIGTVSRLLSDVGISVSLLGDPNVALVTLVVVTVWFLMGFYMLIFLGGLQDIPQEYYEAARIDGASASQAFWHVTMPLLRPTSFFVLLVSMVAAIAGAQVFDLVYVMTGGGPANATAIIILYIYQQAFQYSDFGYAGAMASVVALILLAVTLVMFIATRGGRFSYD